MAKKTWIGGASAVAQVQTASIDSVDATPANNTFTVTMGSASVSVVGDTDVATTATALRSALNSSSHPYFSQVTWSGTGGDIIGTADTPGLPFEAALTETGAGSGTVTDFAMTTANQGAYDASVAANWSDGAVPVSTDVVVLKDSSVSMLWGLDLASVTLAELWQHKTYTGKVGLDRTALVTSADGATTNSAYPEYRQAYLKIGWDLANIGVHFGTGSPSSSSRLKLDNAKSGASTTTIFDTHSNGEANLPAIRLLTAHASADIYIRKAPGGVGIAIDEPGETATVGLLSMRSEQANDRVFVGEGVTLTDFEQEGGNNLLFLGTATLTSAECNGGTLTIEGDQLVTTLNVNSGECEANNAPSAGAAVTNANGNGGVLTFLGSPKARTVTNLTLGRDGQVVYDSTVLTVTNYILPTGIRTVSVL